MTELDDFVISEEQAVSKTKGNWTVRRADIQFVIDCTKTMDFIIEAIKESIIDIVETYEMADITVHLGLTEFRDSKWPKEGYTSSTVHRFKDDSCFTQDVEIFKKRISSLEAIGGGPEKESCFDAIAMATEESDWNDGADSIIVFFSDASPYPDNKIVSGGICGLCPIIKKNKLNQLHLVISDHEPKVLDEYQDILYCVPNPTNPIQAIPGGIYSIGRKDEKKKGKTGNLETLKRILKQIAKTSGRIVSSSSSNPYAEAPELFVLEDGTDCHRMREKKVKKNKRSSSSQNNPYL